MEDDVGLRSRELGSSRPPSRMSQSTCEMRSSCSGARRRRSSIERSLVGVEQRYALGAKAVEKSDERTADRAAAAGQQQPAPPESLLETEHRWDRVGLADNALPVECSSSSRRGAGGSLRVLFDSAMTRSIAR